MLHRAKSLGRNVSGSSLSPEDWGSAVEKKAIGIPTSV